VIPSTKEFFMLDATRLANSLVKLVCRDPSDEGRAELEGWRGASPRNEAFVQRVTSVESIVEDLTVISGMDKASLQQQINAGIQASQPLPEPDPPTLPLQRSSVHRLKPWIWGAAAVVLGCLILAYLLRVPGSGHLTAVTPAAGPIDSFYRKAPVTGGVTLTLADGTVRDLEFLKNGVVARQGGVEASVVEDGKLLKYTAAAGDQRSREGVNELAVPGGSRFKLQLSDGTRVKLNVGSSIRYPIAFTGDKRVVEVTGEVFFEVAHDSRHPFIVKARKEEVEVLGTEFVVSDYPSERHAKVAVASGMVRVRGNKNSSSILHQSQGADIGEGGEVSIDANMDISGMLALKDEFFNFDGLDRKTALQQIAQSYHMRVSFDKNMINSSFGSGTIPRDLPLDKLLGALEEPDLHFEIRMQESTIVVTR
jgi:ferric-dicitrate binding protein FerR (iron transport regulator)